MRDTTRAASFITGWGGFALALVSVFLIVPGIAIGEREAGTTTTVNVFAEAQQGVEQMRPGTKAGTTTTINLFKEGQQGAEQMAPGTKAGTTTTINLFKEGQQGLGEMRE